VKSDLEVGRSTFPESIPSDRSHGRREPVSVSVSIHTTSLTVPLHNSQATLSSLITPDLGQESERLKC